MDNDKLKEVLKQHGDVFRAKPAPVGRECFVNVYPDYTAAHGNLTHHQKMHPYHKLLVIRHLTALHDVDPDTLCRWKITSDEDGRSPTIEVIEEND